MTGGGEEKLAITIIIKATRGFLFQLLNVPSTLTTLLADLYLGVMALFGICNEFLANLILIVLSKVSGRSKLN